MEAINNIKVVKADKEVIQLKDQNKDKFDFNEVPSSTELKDFEDNYLIEKSN